MSDIASFRLATIETKKRARMKARTEVWWHSTWCPNCQAKVEKFNNLEAALAAHQGVLIKNIPPEHWN